MDGINRGQVHEKNMDNYILTLVKVEKEFDGVNQKQSEIEISL